MKEIQIDLNFFEAIRLKSELDRLSAIGHDQAISHEQIGLLIKRIDDSLLRIISGSDSIDKKLAEVKMREFISKLPEGMTIKLSPDSPEYYADQQFIARMKHAFSQMIKEQVDKFKL